MNLTGPIKHNWQKVDLMDGMVCWQVMNAPGEHRVYRVDGEHQWHSAKGDEVTGGPFVALHEAKLFVEGKLADGG